MPSSSEGAALSWRLSGSSIVHSSAPLRGEAPSLSGREHHARLAPPSLDTRLAGRCPGRGGGGHRLSQGLGLARLTLGGHGARREGAPFMPGPRRSCTHSCRTRTETGTALFMPARPSRTPWPARVPGPSARAKARSHDPPSRRATHAPKTHVPSQPVEDRGERPTSARLGAPPRSGANEEQAEPPESS